MKIIGIILLCVVTAAVGFYFAGRLRQRVAILQDILLLFKNVQIEIRYTARPLKAILHACAKETSYKRLEFLQYSGLYAQNQPFYKGWVEALAEFKRHAPLTADDTALLAGFGENMGLSDLEGQMHLIDLFSQKLSEQIIHAETERRQKEKMYRSLGVLCGVGLAVLFI